MQRKKNQRRAAIALGFVAATLAGAALSAPLVAQVPGETQAAQGPFRVLVVDLKHETDAKATRFGRRTAEDVRDGINQLGSYSPVAVKDVDAQLRALGVSKDAFGCTEGRQLAQRMNVEIVMCGTYVDQDGGTKVNATFYGSTADEIVEYAVPEIIAKDEDDAADQIVAAFTGYTDQLRYVGYCVNYLGSEQWEDALRTCEQSLAVNPRSTPSMYGRATAMLMLDRPAEALAVYQQLLEIQPTHMGAMLSAGVTAAKLGQSEVADNYFQSYLALNPGDDQVRMMIADELNKAGDPAGAARQLEEGLAAAPGNYDLMRSIAVYNILAAVNAGAAKNTELANQHYAKALTYYEQVLANRDAAGLSLTEADEAMRYAILAYSQTGQLDKAIALGRTATASDSASAETWLRYATALAMSGNTAEAKPALMQAAARDSTMKVSYQLASFAVEAGNLSEAVTLARAAAAEGSSPEQIEALAQQIVAQGAQREGSAGNAWLEAGRELGATERTRAMANFYQGAALYKQAMTYVPESKAPTASAARTAIPIFQRAKSLLQASSAFTEAAENRNQIVSGINQYLQYLQQIAKGG